MAQRQREQVGAYRPLHEAIPEFVGLRRAVLIARQVEALVHASHPTDAISVSLFEVQSARRTVFTACRKPRPTLCGSKLATGFDVEIGLASLRPQLSART
jgi:hypothetical protein